MRLSCVCVIFAVGLVWFGGCLCCYGVILWVTSVWWWYCLVA